MNEETLLKLKSWINQFDDIAFPPGACVAENFAKFLKELATDLDKLIDDTNLNLKKDKVRSTREWYRKSLIKPYLAVYIKNCSNSKRWSGSGALEFEEHRFALVNLLFQFYDKLFELRKEISND